MADSKIIVKKETLEALKNLKGTYKISSYDEVVSELIKASYSKGNIENISNEDLLFNMNKNDKKSLTRLEVLHTRIGYFEKDYFLKINDISDKLDALNIAKNQNIKIEKTVEKVDSSVISSDEKFLRNKILELENSHQEIEESNEILFRKINLIKSKIIKKTGVFSSGYDATLTEEEYDSIFK